MLVQLSIVGRKALEKEQVILEQMRELRAGFVMFVCMASVLFFLLVESKY